MNDLYDRGYSIFIGFYRRIEEGGASWESITRSERIELSEALAMLREAADQGHMLAQANVGNSYRFGQGFQIDDRLAMYYFEKAALQGHRVCQYNTGLGYRDGRGCEQSFELAVEWYEKSARNGYANAQYELGALCYSGQGVRPRDQRIRMNFMQKQVVVDISLRRNCMI